MSTPRRTLPSLLLLASLAVGCTGGGTDGASTSSPPASTASPVPTGPVHFQPGEYLYEFGGVTARLSFSDGGATMNVQNASGAELPAPALYVIDGTGVHRDGVVTSAAPIPDGEAATFEVTFPPRVGPDTVGLVILLFGDANYGAFAPVPVA